MSHHRTRGKQRRALRSPFLLAAFAAVLGVLGVSQLNTPLSQFVFLASPSPTSTDVLPTQTDVSAIRLYALAPTKTPRPTRTPLPSATPSPTLTATRDVSPTRLYTVTPTKPRRSTERSPQRSTPQRSAPTPSAPTPSATATVTDTPAPVVRTARVPILMYHHIGDLPPDADAIRKSLTVSQERFEEQMRFLAAQGYTTIHLVDLVTHLQTGAPLPAKPIILTFDDGYDDNYVNVFPTLKDFGFKGTFFVIGAPTDYGSPGYLRWEQILEMYDNGMEIGAHSLTHRYNLGTTRPSTQDAEIKQAHALMTGHLANWIPLFSYPSGSYNQYSIDLLKQLGYIGAATTKQGALQSSAKLFELRRIRIRGEWNMQQFLYWFNYWTAQP